MEELTGSMVKVSFLNNAGVTLMSGQVLKANDAFIVVKTNLSVVYIPVNAIKLIQLVDKNEKA
jgi:hypothetical protein